MASPPVPPAGSSSFYPSEGELTSFPNPWFEWEGTGRRLLSPYHSPPPPQTLAHGVAAACLLTPSAPPTSPPPIASPPPPQPAPGLAFCPSDSELVSFYLRPRISGQPLPDATKQFFHEADVYSTDPASLVAGRLPGPAKAKGESKNWYFFSLVKPRSAQDSRRCRIVGGGKGTWKQERGNDVVDDAEGHAIGRLEKFKYTPYPKEDKSPEWLMTEFSVGQQDGGQPRPVLCLCKIYQSPRFLSKNSASKNSASARKRKAPDDRPHLSPTSPSAPARKSKSPADESSAARRHLLFPAPPPPPIPLLPVLFPSPNLPAEDDVWTQILADPELNCSLEELISPSPWPCSMTAAAPSLLGSGHGSQCA